MGRPFHMKLAVLVATVACALGLASVAGAANSDYDNLNGVTLGDTPYSSVTPFLPPMQNFDNLTFGAEPEYSGLGEPKYGQCVAWGWRSAWVRFATAVKGRVFVTVDSSDALGYDVFYTVFTAPTSIPPGSASMTQLTRVECNNSNHGTPNEDYSFGHEIPANQTVYVQVMSVCADHPDPPSCTPQEKNDAPGGLTKLNVRFTPYNEDNDGAPDSLDDCIGTPGPVKGCPDDDGDGVGEPADACPGVKGSRGDGCRVPDEDGDGYAADAADPRLRDCDDDSAAANPGKPEVRGNGVDENCDGLNAFDADGDDWDDAPGPDCDPGNPRINPGARDKPGTRADENCDGRNAKFPRVTSEVSPLYLAVRGRTVGFAQFKVLPARKGDRVRIECEGDNCPYSSKTYTMRRSRSEVILGKEFRTRLLKPGAFVTVKIMRRGHVGRAVRYTLRAASGKPNIKKRCLPPGKAKPLRRC